ncbi:T-complex protein 11 homolog [Chlamydotis macqueenii]
MGEPRRAASARRLARSIRGVGGGKTPRLRPFSLWDNPSAPRRGAVLGPGGEFREGRGAASPGPGPGPSSGRATSLGNRVKETLHRAFWGRLEEQLSASPPDYTRAIPLLQEIEEALLSLLLPQHNQIEEALGTELVRQEAERGALGVHGLTAYILGTMARLCAPVRDEDAGLGSLTDPAQLLGISCSIKPSIHCVSSQGDFLDVGLMKMGTLNLTIQSLRTHSQDHAVWYEWETFQELLDKLPSKWGRPGSHESKAAAEASASSSQPPSHPAVRGSPAACSPGAVSSSTTGSGPTAQVNQLMVVAAVLLVTGGMCGSTLCGSPGFVGRLKWVTKALLEGLSCSRIWKRNALIHCVPELILSTTSCHNAAVLKSSRFIPSLAFSFPLMDRILGDFPKGLDPIQEELLEVRRRFGSVIHHTRQVFGPYCSGILQKMLLPDADPDSGMDSL